VPAVRGRLRLIALIEEAPVIRRTLRHLGLPTEVPEARPSRAPPMLFDPVAECAADDSRLRDNSFRALREGSISQTCDHWCG
jgi:hypothetical protein